MEQRRTLSTTKPANSDRESCRVKGCGSLRLNMDILGPENTKWYTQQVKMPRLKPPKQDQEDSYRYVQQRMAYTRAAILFCGGRRVKQRSIYSQMPSLLTVLPSFTSKPSQVLHSMPSVFQNVAFNESIKLSPFTIEERFT